MLIHRAGDHPSRIRLGQRCNRCLYSQTFGNRCALHKAKQLLDTLRRSMKDLEVYEIEGLSEQQRKELLKRERGWVVVGKRTAG